MMGSCIPYLPVYNAHFFSLKSTFKFTMHRDNWNGKILYLKRWISLQKCLWCAIYWWVIHRQVIVIKNYWHVLPSVNLWRHEKQKCDTGIAQHCTHTPHLIYYLKKGWWNNSIKYVKILHLLNSPLNMDSQASNFLCCDHIFSWHLIRHSQERGDV